MHGILPGKAAIRPRKVWNRGTVGGWAIAVWLVLALTGWGQQSLGQIQTAEEVPEAPSVGPTKGSESPSRSSARSTDSTPEAPRAENSPQPSHSAESVRETSPQAKRSTEDSPRTESPPKPVQSGKSFQGGVRSLAGKPSGDSGQDTYLLRYQFEPGETIRWEVTHQALIRTTVSGVSQTAESVSRSIKVWKVLQVQPDGTAILEHMVENVRMWQKLTGRQEVRYDSQTDKDPPPGFQTIAKSIGVPLAKITLSPAGKVLHRQRYISQPQEQPDSPITMPLPAEPVAVGGSWSETFELEVPLETGAVRKVKTKQIFTLKEVRDHIATIEAATQILTPNLPPEVEAKLIQQASAGTIRFDLHRGRVIEQQIEVDKRVIGFRGEASSLHCMSRFHEKLLPAEQTARRP